MNVQVKYAESEVERQKIHRLRYEIYHEEMNMEADNDLSSVWQFFGPMPADSKKKLEAAFTHLCLAPNERLIQQGEIGDTLYIVRKGKLCITDEESDACNHVLSFKEPGEGVGEIALLTGEKRTASVDAVVKTELVALTRQQIKAIADEAPDAYQAIIETLKNRAHYSRLEHVLGLSNVFKHLQKEILQDLQAELELLTISSGETLMEVGDEGDALFVVISGRLQVINKTAVAEKPYVVELQRGQTVGEMSLITGEKRTATVVALRDSLLAKLSRSSFKKILQKHPEAMLAHFAGPSIERLRQQLIGNQPKAGGVSTIAIIPTDKRVPLAEFGKQFSAALRRLGSATHMNNGRLENHSEFDAACLGKDDPRNERFIFWLDEQEAMHDYMVYEADSEATPWTKHCIRQADLILIVGDATLSPELGHLEASLLNKTDEHSVTSCLVLLHAQETQLPQNTAAWLAPRHVRNHYHVRMRNEGDFQRIGRLLTGQGIGLVLGGGGARAMAHIGVLRALAEKGIPIDVIGGVSGGAIVAGMWAMTLNEDEVLQRCQAVIDRIDYTFPLHALGSGKNWTRSIAKLFGKVQIEDLWQSFYCTSANLSQAQLMKHESDSLLHAVRASTAIPGILPPVFHQGDILVDGGLINNLPADIMKARPDIDQVIAIDVGAIRKSNEVAPFDYSISGWKSLWQRLNPFATAPQVPPIGETLLRSISITSALKADNTQRIINMHLKPPVARYGLMDFNKIKSLAEIGYQYAIEQIDSRQQWA